MRQLPCTYEAIEEAAKLLRQGSLVAFPTETVYGLGSDAKNLHAIEQIFCVKSRPYNQPLSLLISDSNELYRWSKEISDAAYRLAEVFWPGPLTLVLSAAPHVLPAITAGSNKIGLRVPNHPVTQSLLGALGSAIASSSANLSTHLSPTCAAHVITQLSTKVPLLLDGGPCVLGLESTVIDVTEKTPCMLRAGSISQAMVESVLQKPVRLKLKKNAILPRPSLSLRQIASENLIEHLKQQMQSNHAVFGVLASRPAPFQHPKLRWTVMPQASSAYQHCFYAKLQALKAQNCEIILIEKLPAGSQWWSLTATITRLQSSRIDNIYSEQN